MRSKAILYSVLAAFVSVVLVSLAGILYTNYVNHRNDQRWCSVLESIDNAYEQARNNPNTSAAGRHIAEEFHRLREQFGC